MKSIFSALCCIITFGLFSQISIPDSVNHYTHLYESNSISFHELNDNLTAFFQSLPSDQPMTRYEKEFQRTKAFWKNRMVIDSDGQEDYGAYIRALIDYLDSPTCAQSDEAHWKFNFDPSPVNNFEETVGYCAAVTNHASGILTAVYMNPNSPNKIVIGSGSSGIWRSTDGGASWVNTTDVMRIPALGKSN